MSFSRYRGTFRKTVAKTVLFLFLANTVIPAPTTFAAGITTVITYVSPTTASKKTTPGSDIVLTFRGTNASGLNVANPWLMVSTTQQTGYTFTDGV